MTLEEAKKVAAIISQADGGCPVCVRRLLAQTIKAFPEFRWRVVKDYEPLVVEHGPTRVDGDGNRL